MDPRGGAVTRIEGLSRGEDTRAGRPALHRFIGNEPPSFTASTFPPPAEEASDHALYEVDLGRDGMSGDTGRKGLETVDGLGVEAEVGLVAGCLPARAHEEAVVDEGVERADREQCRRQAVQVGVQRRD